MVLYEAKMPIDINYALEIATWHVRCSINSNFLLMSGNDLIPSRIQVNKNSIQHRERTARNAKQKASQKPI